MVDRYYSRVAAASTCLHRLKRATTAAHSIRTIRLKVRGGNTRDMFRHSGSGQNVEAPTPRPGARSEIVRPDGTRDFVAYEQLFAEHPFERTLERIRANEVITHLVQQGCGTGSSILEVGVGKTCVASAFPEARATAIDPVPSALTQWSLACRRVGMNANVVPLTLDDYCQQSLPGDLFDFIVLSSVLHEMPDRLVALRHVARLLAPAGKCIVVVPNATSLHRLLGVALGLMDDLHSQTPTEAKMGQFPAYTEASLNAHMELAGLRIVTTQTFFLKPLSSEQMALAEEAGVLDQEMLDSLERLKRLMPSWGAEILAVGELNV